MKELRLERLSDGIELTKNSHWKRVNAKLYQSELPGILAKIEIGEADVYLNTCWLDGKIVKIDITLSRSKDTDDGLPKSAREVSLEASKFDLARTAMESMCKMASEMLQSGIVDIDYIINDWAGREMFPSGFSPQINGMVKGPSDAAAKLIRQRFEQWREFMKGNSNG
jgi:hypothetical protein